MLKLPMVVCPCSLMPQSSSAPLSPPCQALPSPEEPQNAPRTSDAAQTWSKQGEKDNPTYDWLIVNKTQKFPLDCCEATQRISVYLNIHQDARSSSLLHNQTPTCQNDPLPVPGILDSAQHTLEIHIWEFSSKSSS